MSEKLGNRVGITNPELCKVLAAAFHEQQLKDIQEFERQKLEPVYGIPVMEDVTPKAEASNNEAQVGGTVPAEGEDDGEPDWRMKEFGMGELGFDA